MVTHPFIDIVVYFWSHIGLRLSHKLIIWSNNTIYDLTTIADLKTFIVCVGTEAVFNSKLYSNNYKILFCQHLNKGSEKCRHLGAKLVWTFLSWYEQLLALTWPTGLDLAGWGLLSPQENGLESNLIVVICSLATHPI